MSEVIGVLRRAVFIFLFALFVLSVFEIAVPVIGSLISGELIKSSDACDDLLIGMSFEEADRHISRYLPDVEYSNLSVLTAKSGTHLCRVQFDEHHRIEKFERLSSRDN